MGLALVVAALHFASPAPVRAQDIGPVLHLPMNDGSGSDVAADTSGNDLDGALMNMDSASAWVAGIDGDGLDFDGTNQYVVVTDDDLLDFGAGDFSVSYWAYKQATSEGVCDNTYGVSKWSTGAAGGTNEWALQMGTCPGASGPFTNQASFGVEIGTSRFAARDPENLTLDEWHHVAGVRKGERLRLFIDGIFVAENATLPCNASVNNVGRNLNVARNESTGFLPATDAVFDEVQVYPFALDDGGVALGEAAGGEIATMFAEPAQVIVRPPPTTTTTLVPCPAICGDANRDGTITATDALIDLRAAVGQGTCELCICDVNSTASLTAIDALAILKFSVGSLCELDCPAAG
jgi:hypothetical protein